MTALSASALKVKSGVASVVDDMESADTEGDVLSTVNVPREVGVEVTTLPAKSVPVGMVTIAMPSPEPTVH